MSEKEERHERPCLHCMIVELIDDFFAEYPATAGSDKVDTDEADEVIDANAKTIAELTSQQDGFRSATLANTGPGPSPASMVLALSIAARTSTRYSMISSLSECYDNGLSHLP
jgi:hypothetical protein